MKKRILVNAYFSKNLGDDLFLKVLFDRYPDVEWYMLTPRRDYSEIFGQYKNVNTLKSLSVNILGFRTVNLFRRINEITNYNKYDALVIIGGSIFMEGANWEETLKERSLLPYKFKKLKKKTFIVGANFGPYHDEKFMKGYRSFFSLFDDICFRDSDSFNLFNGPNNVRIAPDVVFNLNLSKKEVDEKSVGFSIINLKKRKELSIHFERYNNKMLELVEENLKKGFRVKLFSFCKSEGDLKIAYIIKNRVKECYRNMVEIIDYQGDIEFFLDKFQSCNFIIGTRFHSIILALLTNQSVFPIIYSDKTYNVLRDLKIERNSCFIQNIDSLTSEIVYTNNQINRKNITERADLQFKEIDNFISNYKVSTDY